MSAVTVKTEPPDALESVTSPLNLSSAALANYERQNGETSSTSDEGNSRVFNDARNFTCLLCDVVCSSRDDLRKHLKNTHASKHYNTVDFFGSFAPEATSHALSGYINYRYTCTICRAKFKSFRTYLTHSMSHRGTGSIASHLDEARMTALFGTSKQYMQDYFESEDGYAGTFTCDECKTVFMQRDAYAMHMMMRAMNETCKPNHVYSVNNNEEEETDESREIDMAASENVIVNQDNTDAPSQRCLEDVTSNVDQDEYLKSVLDKVCSSSASVKNDRSTFTREEQKMCSFCGDGFTDQDSLAMHVMSDHANEMSSSTQSRAPVTGLGIRAQNHNPESYLSWMAAAAAAQPLSAMTLICKYCNAVFLSRDSLAMHVLTHAHLEEKLSEHVRNPKKRKMESLSIDQSLKVPKHSETLDGKRDRHLSELDSSSSVADRLKLFCVKCNIRFYAKSEFEWHIKSHDCANNHHSDSENGKEIYDNTSISDKNITREDTLRVRARRNSTSTCVANDVSSNLDELPQRPVSVGVVSNGNVRYTRYNTLMGNKRSLSVRENKASAPSLESVLSNVRALSSNEQRIIYSVFGKDLSLKVAKAENPDKQQSPLSTEEQAECSKHKEELPPMSPEDLGSQNRHASTPAISKNDDQDGRQKMMSEGKDAPMCKYCEIVFFNKAIYYLHMGLHNVNNPWQCNVCGKICKDAVDFAAHVIHM